MDADFFLLEVREIGGSIAPGGHGIRGLVVMLRNDPFAPRPDAAQQSDHRCAIEAHKNFGPGLVESIYEESLGLELPDAGLMAERQKSLKVYYKQRLLRTGFRADMIVEGAIMVEVKSVEKLSQIHEAQLLTYMRLANTRVGLLFNFNTLKLLNGIKRLAL